MKHLRRNKKIPLTERQKKIVDYLEKNPKPYLNDVARFLRVGRRMAISELKKLHEKGYRQVEGVRL